VIVLSCLPAAASGQAAPPEEERVEEARRVLASLTASTRAAERAEAHNSLGLAHWTRSRFDSALVHLRAARTLWSDIGDAGGQARVYNNIGVTFYQWGHYEPALDAFQHSLALREESGDLRGRALVLSNIGNTLRDLGLYDRALPVLERAVATADTVAQAAVRGYALHNQGLLLMDMGRYAEARVALEASREQYARLDDPQLTKRDASSGWSLNAVHLGLLHVLEGRVDAGMRLLEEVRAQAEADRHVRREATALLHLGQAWQIRGDPARAAAALEQGLRIAQAAEQRTLSLEMLEGLATAYEAQGRTSLALERLRQHQALRDSVFNQRAIQRIASAEARAALNRQEAENRQLREEQQVREAVIARQRLVGALGGSVLVMSMLLVGLLVHFNRTGRERERLLSDANTALAAANEELRVALSEVRTLKGLIPICASCKKVRHDEGYWEAVETYITQRSDALFSHGICADCGPAIYGSDWSAPAADAAPDTAPAGGHGGYTGGTA
jgi:tetratricopeptide (TPR) repeat protein